MLASEFTEAVKVLETLFGKGAYPIEDLRRLWPFAARLERVQLEAVFVRLATAHADTKFAPKFAAVLAAVSAEANEVLREERRAANRELSNARPQCPRCFNTGIVDTVSRTPPHYQASFRCACGAANRLGNVARDMRNWSPELADAFVFTRTHGQALEVIAAACPCLQCSRLKKAPRDPTGDPPGDAPGDPSRVPSASQAPSQAPSLATAPGGTQA